MLRPFDKTVQKRRGGGENVMENQDTKERFKNSITNNNKADSLLRSKNVNQVLYQKEQSSKGNEKGKQPSLTEKKLGAKNDPSKQVIPLKRPVPNSVLQSPLSSKRVDLGNSDKSTKLDFEYGSQGEQELPYVPDDVSPLDLDMFDDRAHMDAYKATTNTTDLESFYDDESFPTKIRQFQQNTVVSPTTHLALHDEEDRDDTLLEDPFDMTIPIEQVNSSSFPTEIEFCPPIENELPFEPDTDKVDLSIFTSTPNVSAYYLSKYFDQQVMFSEELFSDDDLTIALEPMEPLSFLDDHGLTLDDLSALFNSQYTESISTHEKSDEEVDYSDIPFNDHVFDETAIVI
ncbi:uncharacterized protein BX664DRAFT_383555 [Halteromyces radiatus]|uniref:uncharacterized protein n=1 Tax=Halteromyces radiatus TaxID=101107 RepID=UPI00221F11BD|nr:uncharacterized protein BX664DRAFT_383555 [Halteromyces radiatus]KAI8097250.1 hypothetical protein BX664DRAFT_383555 [Halteromyces radiatus]